MNNAIKSGDRIRYIGPDPRDKDLWENHKPNVFHYEWEEPQPEIPTIHIKIVPKGTEGILKKKNNKKTAVYASPNEFILITDKGEMVLAYNAGHNPWKDGFSDFEIINQPPSDPLVTNQKST